MIIASLSLCYGLFQRATAGRPYALLLHSLSCFDAQLRLSFAEKTQIDNFAHCDFTRDFGAPPRLVDHELQTVFRNCAVDIEQIFQRVIRSVGELAFDFAPGDERLHGLVAMVANETIGADGGFDHAADFVRAFFDFSRVSAETEVRKTEKLVGSRQNTTALLFH